MNMKKIYLVLFIIASFVIIPSGVSAEVTGLTAKLERIDRVRSSFPDKDGISFFVEISNTTSNDIRNFNVIGHIKKSDEYPVAGYYSGRLVELLPAGQSTIVEIGQYLLPRSKKLKGTIEFVFDKEFISESSSFNQHKIYKSKFDSTSLSSSVDKGRGDLYIKMISKDTSKKYKPGDKNVKFFSASFKSDKDLNIIDPQLTYYSKKIGIVKDEITNLTLWSGNTQLCGPVSLVPDSGQYQSLQHSALFPNCSIPILKNKKIIVTLKGDVSSNVSKGAKRKFNFSGYSWSEEVDVYAKNLSSKEFDFK
jgi:hypothetical protein